MKRVFRGRPSAGLIVASIALALAIGGTSYAARGLITGANIKNGSIKAVDLATGSVTSLKVRDRSLLAKDFKRGQLPRGRSGTTGQQGPKGNTGPQGLKGADGSKLQAGSIRTVVGPTTTVPAKTPTTVGAADAFASCAAGESIIGGGFLRTDFNNAFAVVNSPDPNTRGRWFVRIANYSPSTVDVQATAICVKVG